MKKEGPRNVAASVRQRLYQNAVAQKEEFGLVLTRYALERFLFRLGQSHYRNRFVLKGAFLFQVWTTVPHRPTRDLDLLGYGDPAPVQCREVMKQICSMAVEDDGLAFHTEAITAEQIKEGQDYEGVRVRITATLSQARIPLQIDIGFGDVVVPTPQVLQCPTLLSMPAPEVLAYSMESVIAEKLEAMVSLGMLNSRMKDFFDIWFLSKSFPFESEAVTAAIEKTFARRDTVWSWANVGTLLGQLATDATKDVQWKAFLRKSKAAGPTKFGEVIDTIRGFVQIVAEPDGLAETAPHATWQPGGPWASEPH